MHIPGIHSFDQDVLMLIRHTTTHYHQRVPIQVGSCITDQATNFILEDELQFLSQSWKLAYVLLNIPSNGMILHHSKNIIIPPGMYDEVKAHIQ